MEKKPDRPEFYKYSLFIQPTNKITIFIPKLSVIHNTGQQITNVSYVLYCTF